MAKKAIKKTLPCYATHKGLDIIIEGRAFTIYGGSCLHPVHDNAEVYVGLDVGMTIKPFRGDWSKHPENIYYPIPDMSVPTNPESFKQLISGLHARLVKGKKIHVGCIGGHGRTGLVLAALVKVATGNAKAIDYVRANYCEHAVETYGQVQWLSEHFGIDAPETDHYKISAFAHLQTPVLKGHLPHGFAYTVKPVPLADPFRIL